jgi:hypothetical protein
MCLHPQRHERAAEWLSVDGALDLHEASRPEEFDRLWHYQGATTTEYGLASRDEPYTMDRIRVSRGDGVTGLARKLRALDT